MQDRIIGNAWKREDGGKGIRNKVLVIYTVECSKHVCEEIVRFFQNRKEDVDLVGSLACLDNQVVIRRLLRYCTHQNVGAVLAVGHGCEYIKPESLVSFAREQGRLGETITLQEVGGTAKGIELGKQMVDGMLNQLKQAPKCPLTIEDLIIGAKCGGSDFTSGLAGNALVGNFFDQLISYGGTGMIEEMGEAIGLRDYLAARGMSARAKQEIGMTYDKTVEYCRQFGHFSISPGNFVGGLTTIEEKSMGAVVKSGSSPIEGVLKIAQAPPHKGFWLLDVIPDYDIEPGFYQGGDASGLLDQIASKCHLLLFVTGRGHVGGTPISPVIKITGNADTYSMLSRDIDVSAAGLLTGEKTMEQQTEELWQQIYDVCNGKQTLAEQVGHREGTLFFNNQDPGHVIPYEYGGSRK